MYSHNAAKKFVTVNKLQHIVRSRQLCLDGYQELWELLTTVWSAPNFCNYCKNVAAVMEIAEGGHRYMNTYLEAPERERKIPPFDLTKEIPDYYAF